MSKMLLSERTLTAEQREAIGTVAVETTYLEHRLERLIWRLLGIRERYQIGLLTDRLGITQKLDIAYELGRLRLREDEDLQQWSVIVNNMRKLIDQRNLIIHGIWMVLDKDETTPTALRLKPKGTRKLAVEDIRKVAEDIGAANDALKEYAQTHFFWNAPE